MEKEVDANPNSSFKKFNRFFGKKAKMLFSPDSDDHLDLKHELVKEFLRRFMVQDNSGLPIQPHPSTVASARACIRIYLRLVNPLLFECQNLTEERDQEGFCLILDGFYERNGYF